MARPPARCSSCWNPSPTGKDKLAGAAPGPAPTEASNTSTPALAVSRVSTPAPPDAFVAIPSPATALAATAPSSDNEFFKQFMKAYLEAQVPGQIEIDPELCKQPFKTRFLDFYYGNLHIYCYRFCQQCEKTFETAEAKGPNRILFAALFLCGLITQQWLQHKQRRDGAVPMTWPEFKKFFWKNLGDFKVFVDSVWKKVKCNSQY